MIDLRITRKHIIDAKTGERVNRAAFNLEENQADRELVYTFFNGRRKTDLPALLKIRPSHCLTKRGHLSSWK